MKGKRLSFKKAYFIFLSVLVAAAIALLIYVNVLLHQYEDLRPERRVEEAVDALVADASAGDFWNKYSLPTIKSGKYEKHIDVQKEYLALYSAEKLEYSQKNVSHEEDELYYIVENDGFVLAEIKLKATAPAVTKLAVLSFREWQIEYIKPIFEASEYTISVPVDFNVSVNGISLTTAEGAAGSGNEIIYTVKDVYLEPSFDITDKDGNVVTYTVDNKKVLAEFYDYTLTLPEALMVELNGKTCQGEVIDGNRVRYDIRLLEKPVISISDFYGNTVSYEGGDEFPLTYATVTADSRYTVQVSGKEVPKEAITSMANNEYEQLVDYVDNLPGLSVYDVAILENNAEISVTDEMGNPVPLEQGQTVYDFTSRKNALKAVPDEVSAEIDVLEVAQMWSLFMSNDARFAQIDQYLIKDSYQYNVAVEYATGVDITFTSEHTLRNPAFTETSVTNFVWIADNCFSVDISFVKHMVLLVGTKVDDPMNDRFYFVKYDDTDDGIDNPTWKIAGMKEIVSNEK